MRPPLTSSTVSWLLSLALLIQLLVLATRLAAWQRYRTQQETGQVPAGRDPRTIPQTRGQALVPLLSSAYGALLMAVGLLANWIARPAPLTVLLAVVILFVPALLADPILFLVERLRKK